MKKIVSGFDVSAHCVPVLVMLVHVNVSLFFVKLTFRLSCVRYSKFVKLADVLLHHGLRSRFIKGQILVL